jgi:hypothetical protein
VSSWIDDDQPVTVQAAQFAFEVSFGVGRGEAGEPAGGGVERDRVGRLGSLDTQSYCQVGLSGSGWSEQDDVLAFGDDVVVAR